MRERIRAFVERGGGDFDALALELFRWQVARDPVHARIADGARPATVEEIPAVPVDLFKELEIGHGEVVFRTSGTTQGRRGTHRMRDTALYDLGATRHFRACVPDAPRRVVSLCSHAPDSSLGHMVDLFGEVERCFDDAAGVSPATWDAIRRGPCLLAATAFALDALFATDGHAALDARSVVMVTGGFKGRRTRVDARTLYREIAARLGAPRVVGEYGMTELSSQLWTDPVPAGEAPGPFRAPPWLRAYTVDPTTGAPVSAVGLLRFVDLLNVDGVAAIETLDLGAVDGDRVDLHGRLEGAEARGCSLRAEEAP